MMQHTTLIVDATVCSCFLLISRIQGFTYTHVKKHARIVQKHRSPLSCKGNKCERYGGNARQAHFDVGMCENELPHETVIGEAVAAFADGKHEDDGRGVEAVASC